LSRVKYQFIKLYGKQKSPPKHCQQNQVKKETFLFWFIFSLFLSSSVDSEAEYGEELNDGRKVFLSLFAALIFTFAFVLLTLWNY
jgi:hypothetical protein